jgi:hypothetical protein
MNSPITTLDNHSMILTKKIKKPNLQKSFLGIKIYTVFPRIVSALLCTVTKGHST